MYSEYEYSLIEIFVKDELKKLREYNELIEKYHILMLNFPTRIQKTAFTGLFKVCRKIFIETIVEYVNNIRDLLINSLIERYQNIAKE